MKTISTKYIIFCVGFTVLAFVVGEIEQKPKKLFRISTLHKEEIGLRYYNYTLGRQIEGDHPIYFTEKNSVPNDVTSIRIRYPERRSEELDQDGAMNPKRITFITVLVEQKSHKGKTLLLNGGIGETFVELLLLTAADGYKVIIFGI